MMSGVTGAPKRAQVLKIVSRPSRESLWAISTPLSVEVNVESRKFGASRQ